MDYRTEIKNLIESVDSDAPAFRQKKRELREKYRNFLQEQTDDKGNKLTDKEIKAKLMQMGKDFRELSATQEVQSGAIVLNPILRMRITDEFGVEYGIDSLLNTKLGKINVGGDSAEIRTDAFMKNIKNYAKTLPENQSVNLLSNIKRIKAAATRQSKKKEKVVRGKMIDVNIRKYLGATDLSKASTRVDIYDFWGEVAKKYKKFEKTLKNFFDKALTFDISEGEEKITEVERNKINREFTSELRKIQQKYADMNLEYIANFTKVDVPVEKDPKKRLLQALDRLVEAQQLTQLKRPKDAPTEDEPDESQRSWEAAYMAEQEERTGYGGQEIEIGIADEEGEEELKTKYDVYSLENAYKVPVDPLLAYEVMKNVKLLAFTEESRAVLREALDSLRDEETDLDFRTDLTELINQLKDTLVLEQDNYFLPISVIKNNDFKTFARFSKLTSALNNQNMEVDILETLNELFNDIEDVITDEKFAFAMGVRASGRVGIGGKPLGYDERKEARGGPMQSMVYETMRISPTQGGKRGKLRNLREKVMTPLKELLQAYNEYYIEPLYAGRLPIEVPRYATGRGAKVLTILLKDLGGISVTSDVYEMLATTERATLSVQTMRDLANFLVKLQSPNIRVDDALISLAEDASVALTDIFGAEEKNRNYVSAVLMHFMEETGDMDKAREQFYGKSIRVRANAFERDYKKRKSFPIFALPQFIDSNQSLLTKDNKRKEQYKRLRGVLDEVEDDLPLELTKLLKAHDAIRKALGKPVFYGFMPISYYSIEKMVDYLYKNKQVDLSHLEIGNIVKSFDSHKNISKEYGITEESVYLIKANFR